MSGKAEKEEEMVRKKTDMKRGISLESSDEEQKNVSSQRRHKKKRRKKSSGSDYKSLSKKRHRGTGSEKGQAKEKRQHPEDEERRSKKGIRSEVEDGGRSERNGQRDQTGGGYDQDRPETSGVQPTCPEDTVSHKIKRLSFYHRLGRGSFGNVILAADTYTSQHLAVKVISKRDLLVEGSDRALVERRVLELASGSAFLVHAYFAFQTKEHVLLGMEYASGGDFHKFLQRKGCLKIPRARFYAAEIVCGVQFLHSKGIVHRDLKPHNILVAATGHLKIADFGLAIENIYGDRTATDYVGTPGYVAPEILAGEEYNAAADWYSFGVVLTQMITGTSSYHRRLFEAADMDAKNIIKKLLREDPARRLGAHGNIRRHPFFQRIDWVSMEALEIEPPYVPNPPTMAQPSRKITLEFLEAAEAQRPPIPDEDQGIFRGFSFDTSNWRTLEKTLGL